MNWKATRAGLNLWARSVFGLPHRRGARRAWDMDTAEFWESQDRRFEEIYRFALESVPYYREQRGAYPDSPRGEGVLEKLRALPVLSKQVVREHNEAFWSSPRLRLAKIHTTSGTSGTPLRLSATPMEKGLQQAIMEEWYRRICGRRRPRTLFLSGFMTPDPGSREIAWSSPLTGDVYLSIYALNVRNRRRILDIAKRLEPELIYGYASAVHELALLFDGRPPVFAQTRAGVVTSEVLQPQWREAIESSLCDKLYDLYGSQEGSHLMMQCSKGNMHIHPLVGVVEIVDDDDELVKPGDAGRVLVTGLARKSMPLFRYDLGDTVVSTGYEGDCLCGLGWPAIGAIEGRSEDLVVTRSGSRVGYLCFHATKDLQGIRESQLVQTDYERFVCNLVVDEGVSRKERHALELAIQGQLNRRLQTNVEVDFRYPEQVPRGARGKFKAVVVDFTGPAVEPGG